MPTVQPPPHITERTFVTPGLADQDDNIDLLLRYFQEMQKTTVETSQPDDLLSFAACAPYFGVVMLETTTTPLPEEYISDDEVEQEVALVMPLEPAESIYLASSRTTSLPVSERLQELRAAASTTPTETLFPTLSERDKVLLWREAFMAKIEEDADEPLVPLPGGSPGVSPIYASAFPEVGPAAEAPMHVAHTADETGSDFINWPDEGPAHEASTDASSEDTQEADYMVLDGASPVLSPHAEDGVGREHLNPEVYTSPAKEPAELQQDPHMQTLVYESAKRFQQELREQRVKEYLASQRRQQRQRARARNPKPVEPPTTTRKPIGLIYLWTSQTFLDPLHMGECGLGVYIDPEHRGKDCLLGAVDGVVKFAFQDPNCHRLQSIIVENPDKLYTLELLARAGFRNEGIRRRAFFSTGECEWKDVTYFAMLATEWVYDANNDTSAVRLRTTSLWDEVFARHQKECDDLIRLEEKSTLKRSCSLETIRERVVSSLSIASSVRGDEDDDATDTGSSMHSGVSMGAKRRRLGYKKGQWRSTAPSLASTSSGPGSEWEVASVASTSALRAPPRSSASSVSESISSPSQWDVL
ncbi:hypothetical protein HYPSUDRAFT_284726 [Hypholoma sublateritium FD-334 SS-4]|uniref:N-acetyltransferase domain-containing protein n=1 Tax=Hypholoma sublateritium (strain FD-334 SS-4) TaxID=945553 RepID=A0A0D2P8L0_HYPSF|nr:hypothetical protein HYPSUDRAFT_284726 [Hypholoma sublateritium FD-334 SS-4]